MVCTNFWLIDIGTPNSEQKYLHSSGKILEGPSQGTYPIVVEVPESVPNGWAARDSDGSWFLFREEPVLSDGDWDSGGVHVELPSLDFDILYMNSKVRIDR